jgi:hypothetical protein
MTAINRLKRITFDRSGLNAKKTLTAIAVGSLLFLTSCGQPVEKIVEKETPRVESDRKGVSKATMEETQQAISAMEDAQRAIDQSNAITGVKKPSVIQTPILPTLQPIPSTTILLGSATQSLAKPNAIDLGGTPLSPYGEMYVKALFTCRNNELYFYVQGQAPLNMGPFSNCPLQIEAIPMNLKQGGATLSEQTNPLVTLLEAAVTPENNLQLRITQASNGTLP